jgi:hypothetical protein
VVVVVYSGAHLWRADPSRFLPFADRVIGRVALWGDAVEGDSSRSISPDTA